MLSYIHSVQGEEGYPQGVDLPSCLHAYLQNKSYNYALFQYQQIVKGEKQINDNNTQEDEV